MFGVIRRYLGVIFSDGLHFYTLYNQIHTVYPLLHNE